jgi:hypothetical protein
VTQHVPSKCQAWSLIPNTAKKKKKREKENKYIYTVTQQTYVQGINKIATS